MHATDGKVAMEGCRYKTIKQPILLKLLIELFILSVGTFKTVAFLAPH